MKEDKVNACVINLPKDTQNAQYINSHLPDAKMLYDKGRFIITSCSHLPLDENYNPKISAGVYPSGESEKEHLNPFFNAIVELAISLLKK